MRGPHNNERPCRDRWPTGDVQVRISQVSALPCSHGLLLNVKLGAAYPRARTHRDDHRRAGTQSAGYQAGQTILNWWWSAQSEVPGIQPVPRPGQGFTDGRTELACLAHIRRKFFDVHAASGSPVAEEALRRIAALYAIEQQGAGLDPPQRLALRQKLAMPALAELHAWLLATQRTVAVGSGTAKAVDHALKRWPALQRYAGSGTLPIGRVEMWRGSCRQVPAAPFPHPPRRTGRADFPHPALFRRIKPSRSSGRVQLAAGVSDPISRRGTGRDTGGIPFPACRCACAARFANAVPCSHRYGGRSFPPALD